MARPKDETKIEEIFQATLRLVLQTGYGGLKMADVAKEANIGIGTIYTYFENKTQLINELYLRLKQKKVDTMFLNYDAEAPFFVTFKRVWFNLFAKGWAHPQEIVFLEQFYRSNHLSIDTKQTGEQMAAPIGEIIYKAIENQIIINLPPSIIYAQVLGAMTEIIKYHIDTQNPPTQPQMEAYFEMAWKAIRK